MTKYRFTGAYELTYPGIMIPGEGSLVAKPGDVRELEHAPDFNWIPVEEPRPEPEKTVKVAAKNA